jgi:hypothetical protein
MRPLEHRYSEVSPLTPLSFPRTIALGVLLAAAALILGSYWIAHAERVGLPDVCAGWDEAAKRTLAPLMHQQRISQPDRPLLDALTALRRARHNCTAGHPDLARRDYGVVFRIVGLPPSQFARD